MKRRPLRRAGAAWRILVHRHQDNGRYSDMAYHVQSDRAGDKVDSEYSKTTVLDRTEFDELVVGQWIHIEAMDTGIWWMNVAGVTLWVKADRDGKPLSVSVYGPGDYAEPVPDCRYTVDWSNQVSEDDTPTS